MVESPVQITLFQLDDYGPWTVTPEPRPEMALQALQSRLYADLASAVGRCGGYVFYTRGDNLVAVTNGLDRKDHRRVQTLLGERYPVTVSAALGVADRPADALGIASERLQSAGSAQDANRRAVLLGESIDDSADGTHTPPAPTVEIAHFDVVDATATMTDRDNAADTFLAMRTTHIALARQLRTTHGGLAFFAGGDNVIAVVPGLDRAAYAAAIAGVREDAGVELRVGVGRGHTAHAAGMTAKHALEVGREEGRSIVFLGADGVDRQPGNEGFTVCVPSGGHMARERAPDSRAAGRSRADHADSCGRDASRSLQSGADED